MGYFIGKSHFDEDGAQKYLGFQAILEYFIVTGIVTGLQNESQKDYLTKVSKLFLKQLIF